MLTNEDIATLGMEVTGMGGTSVIYTKRDSDDLKQLALLGLAVVESGVTVDDIASVSAIRGANEDANGIDRVFAMVHAVGAALQEGESR